eukprot:768291-Hanusia_phi.AAC.6
MDLILHRTQAVDLPLSLIRSASELRRGMQGDAAGMEEAMGTGAEVAGMERCRRQYVSMMDEGKSLEEITLKMLDELGHTVQPARYVPNVEAIQWTVSQLQSASPPQELDMEWFSVGDAEATQLAEVLRTNATVTTIKLRYNEIRDEGAKALVRALASCLASHPSVQHVYLGNNIIGSDGADALAVRMILRAIAENGRIRKLDLRYNNVRTEDEAFQQQLLMYMLADGPHTSSLLHETLLSSVA